MTKKSQSKTADQNSSELVRDENGFGTLPQFENFHIPAEGFAPGAVVNGNEVAVVTLENDDPAKDIHAAWLEGEDVVADWNPTTPAGDGWKLIMVQDAPEGNGPFAVFVRPAEEKPLEGRAYAEEFLLGSLIKAATKHLKTLAKPWIDLKENEQQRVLNAVHTDCREAVRDAIDIVAGNARLTFTAAVDQVVFKDGVKAVLTLAKTPEAHSLADAEGSFVTIVIEERSKLLQEGDALTIDPDQKPLFDQSTEGTQVETEKSVLKAA